MKILRSSQIRDVDAYTILNEPILSIDLMERAAMAVSNWINKNINKDKIVKIFVGPGNNGGDGLAIARQIQQYNYTVEVYFVKISENLSADNEINLKRLKKNKNIYFKEIISEKDFPGINKKDILVDALFGSGLTRKLEGLSKNIVKYLNNAPTEIIAIDIPSGLFGEDNSENDFDAIIKAKHTLTFQVPKLSFFFSKNETFVGNYTVLPIGLDKDFMNSMETPFCFIEESDIKAKLKVRRRFSHKGTFGHVMLISGSYGKMGAAILAAKACLRAGCGLLTTHVPRIGYEIIQTTVPESMICIDCSDIIFTEIPHVEDYAAVGIGPGIGVKQNTQKALFSLLENVNSPMVIDADGLNILSENKEWIKKIPENSILTPHPKEFERLVGKSCEGYERIKIQMEFAVQNNLYVVLKGANTSIACPDGMCYFNSTGNPGMATAGSGDVLTGVILSLLGQTYSPKYAAIIGVYLHGLAGDIASEKLGQEAVIASDIIDYFGKAYLELKE